jgi:5'-deoxynucleotidase YfbR-like HD superfamily hydrolase
MRTNQDYTDRKGSFMFTITGNPFWPFDPRLEDLNIETIAHHLSLQCRYNGAISKFYSVAEHSVYVSRLCKPEDALEGLLHDASEAYIGDLTRPLKRMSSLGDPFKAIELELEKVISKRFQLAYPWPESVKYADDAVAAAEIEQLCVRGEFFKGENAFAYNNEKTAPDLTIQCLHWSDAKELFLDRYVELMDAKDLFLDRYVELMNDKENVK